LLAILKTAPHGDITRRGETPEGQPNPPFEGVPGPARVLEMERGRKNVELTPEQPAEVAEQVAAALELGSAVGGPDPWWQAGLQEQLEQ
jgi:hypothetical protein